MKNYRTNDVLKLLKISRKTLENYEKRGLLIPTRVGRTKFFSQESIDKLLDQKSDYKDKKKIIAYYRVSTNSQKLESENQRKCIETYAINSGKCIDEYLFDIGSGINFKRKNFLKLIDMIEKQEIEEIIVTYKDRLTRFGYELIEERCKINNVKLTVINLESTSPQQELVEDLMTIIHVFSCRLYGLRKYKKQIKEELGESDDVIS